MPIRRWAATAGGGAPARVMQRLNARHPWSHNDHFHGWILDNLPDRCEAVLDVGCGRGELLARLAPRVHRVVGTDRDAAMRTDAARRCVGLTNVSVEDGPWNDLPGPFDAVTMVAVLHHLELEPALRDVRRLLAPGGRFLVVGLAGPQSWQDNLWDAASILTNPIIGYVKHPRADRTPGRPAPFPVRDPELSLAQVRAVFDRVLPGSRIRRRLAFRHTVVWTKPGR